MLTRFTAGHIRSLYSSGLYHKADLFTRFVFEVKTTQGLEDVLNYKVHSDYREDLRLKIVGLGFVQELTDEYHKELQIASIMEHEEMMADPKNAPALFEQTKNKLQKQVREKLKFLNAEFQMSFTPYDIHSRLYR